MSLIQPESDLSLSIVILGADIIEILSKAQNYSLVIEKVMKNFLKKDSRRTHELFFDTLAYLYMIEIILVKNYKISLKLYGKTQKSLLSFLEKS